MLRRTKLDESCQNNDWTKPFYAPHTFEVDFLMAGNQDEVVSALPGIFETEPARQTCEAKLRSGDVAVAGKEMLRLAKKEGKGWFAVLLAEHVSEVTVVPQYVLDAVAFACNATIDHKTICQMIKHRCDTCHPDSQNRQRVLATFAAGTAAQICEAYSNEFPDDVLASFITLLG